MNKKTFLIISIILLSIIPLIPGYAEESDWIMEERGADYEIYYASTDPDQKRWNSAPIWVYNGSEYVPYIYYRDEAKKCYTVQSGLIAAEIYDTGISKFYDPQLKDERIKNEFWELWHLDGSVWKKASLDSSISFLVNQYPDSIIIEALRFTYKPDGFLIIRYLFNAGKQLKHEVFWQSLSTETEIVEVRQVWDLKLSTDKVVLDNGELLTTSTNTDSIKYIFGDDQNDFLVSESQWSATYYPDGTLRENGRFTEADIDFAGKKVTFTFSNWTLAQNEYLTIDPYTATLTPPTKDTWIQTEANNGGDTSLKIQGRVGAGIQRLLVEFDISSIPSDAIFSLGRLDLYCGSESNDDGEVHQWRRITGAWEEMVVVWSTQPSITETNGVNLAAPTGLGWHNITITDMVSDARSAGTILGIRGKDSVETRDYTSYTTFHSKEGVNDPRLYLEYTQESIQVQYYTVTDSRVNVNDNVNIDVHLHYISDNAHVVDGTVTVNGISASQQGTGTWRITQSKSTAQGITYNTIAASGNSRGVSTVDQNGQSQLEIWDRYNVTSFWASSYDLQTGDNATLYAIFESEYDSHICDGDDSITIEDLSFTYDPIEEYYFAEVGKDESGTYYFDTLNSIHENTYNITSGNLDYNLSIAWCDYHYEFYGLYFENGTYSGNVTVNAYFEDTVESFLLEYETTKNYEETPFMFTWELEGGGLRKFYTRSYNETFYLFAPFDEYSSYSFEIKDYSGQVGSADSYLEAYEVINGTERMIERALIRDAANPTTLVLQKYRAYRLQIRCGTGAVYSFPHFTPSVEPTPILIIHAIEWGDQIHYVGENITVEFSRPSYTHIRINYKDEREHTTSIFVEVLLKNLTQVWNDTSTEQLIQFNWYGANNTTDYLVRLIAQHEDFGEIGDSGWLSGLQPSYEDPPDESVLGDWPINNVIGISMLIGTFCVFSAGTKSNLFGTFATVGIGYVLVSLNFLSTPYYVLHACMVITLLWGLTGGRT